MSNEPKPQPEQSFLPDLDFQVPPDPVALKVGEEEPVAKPEIIVVKESTIDHENELIDKEDQAAQKALKTAELNEKTQHSEFRASFPQKVWEMANWYVFFVILVILAQGYTQYTGFHVDKEIIVNLIDAIKFIGGGVAATAISGVFKAALAGTKDEKAIEKKEP